MFVPKKIETKPGQSRVAPKLFDEEEESDSSMFKKPPIKQDTKQKKAKAFFEDDDEDEEEDESFKPKSKLPPAPAPVAKPAP